VGISSILGIHWRVFHVLEVSTSSMSVHSTLYKNQIDLTRIAGLRVPINKFRFFFLQFIWSSSIWVFSVNSNKQTNKQKWLFYNSSSATAFKHLEHNKMKHWSFFGPKVLVEFL